LVVFGFIRRRSFEVGAVAVVVAGDCTAAVSAFSSLSTDLAGVATGVGAAG
jgi:hypothetical protein